MTREELIAYCDSYHSHQRSLGVNDGADGGFDFGSLEPEQNPVERALSWFKLIFCCVSLPIALTAMVILYRSRSLFEIRARSPYLCMIFGCCVLAALAIAIDVEAYNLFGRFLDPYAVAMAYYFFLVCTVCSYGCRTIRLAVVFSPRGRRMLPALIPERNHVMACLVIAICSLSLPIYDRLAIGDKDACDRLDRSTDQELRGSRGGSILSDFDGTAIEARDVKVSTAAPVPVRLSLQKTTTRLGAGTKLSMCQQAVRNNTLGNEFARKSNERLWTIEIAFQGLTMAMYPFVRNVDDIFDIGPELRMLMMLELLLTVGGKLGETYGGDEIGSWINSSNISMLAAAVAFGVTIIDPLRKLHSNMRKKSDPDMARAIAMRKQRGLGERQDSSLTMKSAFHSTVTLTRFAVFTFGDRENTRTSATEIEDGQGSGTDSADSNPRVPSHGACILTWEMIEAEPALSAAFERFARKALCLESVLFLREVARYQSIGSTDVVDMEAELLEFQRIARRFISESSPDEVNISSHDKKELLELLNGGPSAFSSFSAEQRRYVFADVYVEVRYVLEANLMRRFIMTEEFRRAREEAAHATADSSEA